jgi:hypothetical protein
MGFLVDWAVVGCEPATLGLRPGGAVDNLFKRTALGFDDLARVELNEAFAAQVLAVVARWDWYDEDKLNVQWIGQIAGPSHRGHGGCGSSPRRCMIWSATAAVSVWRRCALGVGKDSPPHLPIASNSTERLDRSTLLGAAAHTLRLVDRHPKPPCSDRY